MVTRTCPYTVLACGRSDIGLVRENNEDVWHANHEDYFFIVADGMGGHSAGEIAANETANALSFLMKTHFRNKKGKTSLKEIGETIKKMIQEVNAMVYRMGQTERGYKGMGTTLCCVYFHSDGMIHAHVGDSRIYLLKNKKLTQLTEDHSLVAELVELGELNRRQAQECTYRNIITKAIGTEPFVTPTIAECAIEVGDQVLMCSDGLSDMVSLQEIEKILIDSPTEAVAVDRLIARANYHGGHDNVTVLLMKVTPDDLS